MEVPEEISTIIEKNGNTFNAKVARWFSDNKWKVVVSPYYMDQTQKKAREIDLIAEKVWGTRGAFVVVRLFIECKYVNSHSVFWFGEKDTDSAYHLVCDKSEFGIDNQETEKHHYVAQSTEVAKLFSSEKKNNQEREPFYNALNQVLNGMVSMRHKPFLHPDLKLPRGTRDAVLQFPLVVCSEFNKIYRVDFYNESDPKQIKDNFQLEVRYAYFDKSNNQRDEYFLLDFVEFEQLGKFASFIDKDVEAAKYFVSTRYPE